MIRGGEPYLVLFLESIEIEESTPAFTVFKKAAKTIKKILPCAVLSKDGPDESNRVYHEEAISDEDTPGIYIIEKGKQLRYKMEGEITVNQIEIFVQKWKNNQLKAIYKSSEPPATQEG